MKKQTANWIEKMGNPQQTYSAVLCVCQTEETDLETKMILLLLKIVNTTTVSTEIFMSQVFNHQTNKFNYFRSTLLERIILVNAPCLLLCISCLFLTKC